MVLPLRVLVPHFVCPGGPSALKKRFVRGAFNSGCVKFTCAPISRTCLGFNVVKPFVVVSVLTCVFALVVGGKRGKLKFCCFLLCDFIFSFYHKSFSSVFCTLLVACILKCHFFGCLLTVGVGVG